jgi:hypothetical protein
MNAIEWKFPGSGGSEIWISKMLSHVFLGKKMCMFTIDDDACLVDDPPFGAYNSFPDVIRDLEISCCNVPSIFADRFSSKIFVDLNAAAINILVAQNANSFIVSSSEIRNIELGRKMDYFIDKCHMSYAVAVYELRDDILENMDFLLVSCVPDFDADGSLSFVSGDNIILEKAKKFLSDKNIDFKEYDIKHLKELRKNSSFDVFPSAQELKLYNAGFEEKYQIVFGDLIP